MDGKKLEVVAFESLVVEGEDERSGAAVVAMMAHRVSREHTLVEFLHHIACLSQAVGLQADCVEVHIAGPLVVDVAHSLEAETFASV